MIRLITQPKTNNSWLGEVDVFFLGNLINPNKQTLRYIIMCFFERDAFSGSTWPPSSSKRLIAQAPLMREPLPWHRIQRCQKRVVLVGGLKHKTKKKIPSNRIDIFPISGVGFKQVGMKAAPTFLILFEDAVKASSSV